jgi:2-keto-4-pentenoate hydratase/2-oxohepta-3-ene-1,7-dioic acid hydratase in catechol pathway
MRLVTFLGAGVQIGALAGDEIVVLNNIADTMLELIERGQSGLKQAAQVIAENRQRDRVPLASVQLLAPIPRPTKNIFCLGMNYAEHARESMRAKGLPETLPSYPVIFTKSVTTVNRPDGDVPLDANVTQQLDWEVELAFIIGRGGKNIGRAEAMQHVWGYTIINDVSARDLQNRHQQFFKGKSLDGSCPMGPCILTADEVPDPSHLRLQLRVNGETRQDSTAADLIFDIPAIIETLSLGQTLEPGDIIATGTPSGVGMGMQPQQWLKVGDVMEAEIDRIGVLRNTVVAAK